MEPRKYCILYIGFSEYFKFSDIQLYVDSQSRKLDVTFHYNFFILFLTNLIISYQDQINCPFYLKTGACRYGGLCGRHHPYPDKSVTILIKNMYEGMPIQLADEDNDDNLEVR